MLLGSSPAVQQAISNGNGTLPGMPAAATFTFPSAFMSGLPPATIVLVVEVLGLVFIGLVSVAGFSVMAQRRLRALGLLSAIGATERNLRLVMVAGGVAVGVAGAPTGGGARSAAWFAYVPARRAPAHVIDAANLPWWAFAIGVVLAIATSVWPPPAGQDDRPGTGGGRVVRPPRAAQAGAPHRPARRHRVRGRRRVPGVQRRPGRGGGPRARLPRARAAPAGRPSRRDRRHRPARPAGHQHAEGQLPAAGRNPDRAARPGRYRARSGAALAAITFAVFAAMGICLVASIKFDDPLAWSGPNLSSSQLIIYTQQSQGGGLIAHLSGAQAARLGGQVSSLAARLHTRSVPLESLVTLSQAGTPQNSPSNFTGTVYVATPQLLATYGIKASQIAPGADILTMRPGLAGVPHLEMTWSTTQSPGQGPPCTLSNDCLACPVIRR